MGAHAFDLVRACVYGTRMKIEDVLPAHCHARATRLLGELALVRDEMGRSADARPAPEVTGAQPREVYFEAIVAWRKASRLAEEVGAAARRHAPAAPSLRDLKPGHVLQQIDGVLGVVEDIKQRFGITESVQEPAIENSRQPSDVLVTLVRVNRELSRTLERPFTPTDVFHVVALASAYAARLGGAPREVGFERKRKPADCYERLTACLAAATKLVDKRGQPALAVRGAPPETIPSDVYDLANLVLGELAYLHALAQDPAPLHAFEPGPCGHRLPAHVYQLARTLEAQLAAIGS